MKEKSLIKIKIKGEGVGFGKIDAKILGYLLIDFQTLLNYVAKKVLKDTATKSKEFYEKYGLAVNKIEKGSAVVLLTPMGTYGSLEGGSSLEVPLKELITIIGKIDEDPKESREYLIEKLNDNRDRLAFETKLYDIWPDVKREIEISFEGTTFSTSEYIPLKHERKEVLMEWINEDMKAVSKKINGIITRIKVDGKRRYFVIKSMEGELYKFEYTDINRHIEDKYLDFIRRPIEVVGITEGGVKGRKIREILDLKPLEELYIDEIGRYPLRKPMKIKVEYDFDDELWILGNDELGLVGIGESYDEAMNSLEESLEVAIDIYLNEDEKNLSEKAIELKKKLKGYLKNHNAFASRVI